MNVIKRNGKEVSYDSSKVLQSIVNANMSVSESNRIPIEKIEKVLANAQAYFYKLGRALNADEIADRIEQELVKVNAYYVAKSFIEYRFKRAITKKSNSTDGKILSLVDCVNEEANQENANKNPTIISTQRDYIAGEISRDITERLLLPKEITDAHKQGLIHYHDSDYFINKCFNCVDGSGWVKIKHNNVVRTITLSDFADEIGLIDGQIADMNDDNYQILSRDGWTPMKLFSRRKPKDGELLYVIRTRTGIPLKLTGEHRLPIKSQSGEEMVVKVKDLKLGDSLLDIETAQLSVEDMSSNFLDLTEFNDDKMDLRIINPKVLKSYLRFKYKINFAKYARDNRFVFEANRKCIAISDFKRIMEDYPLSFDVLSSLRIKANGSKHEYPLFLTYTPQLAKLYAYIYADGGVYINEEQSTYQLTFTNTNEELVDDFIKCYKSCFGYTLRKYYPNSGQSSPCIRVVDSNRLLVSLFKDFAGARKYNASDISVPDFVMNGSREIQMAYLSACIDTDGYLSNNEIAYASCCERYCEQLCLILKGLGYNPCVKMSNEAGSVYRFGRKSGVRKYNGYRVCIYRTDEKNKLVSEMNCFKHNDSYCFGGLNGKFNENKIVKITTECSIKSVYDIETESHWYIVNNYVSHNCCLVNLEDMLQNGTCISKTMIEKPHRFSTACNITTQIIAQVASNQYGGQTISIAHLAPFVDISRKAIYEDVVKNFEETGIEVDEEQISKIVENQLKQEIKNGIQMLQYQVITLMTTNGQAPFVSFSLYLNEAKNEQEKKDLAMLIEEIFRQRIKGVKNEQGAWIAPAFPKLLYFLEDDNIEEGQPYYYLTKIAAECTSKRMVPDYISEKVMIGLKKDVNNDGHAYPSMGCRSFLTVWNPEIEEDEEFELL